jgi:hypothetical protein
MRSTKFQFFRRDKRENSLKIRNCVKFTFAHIKDEILSPGNIFWKKNNGADILISKKGDVLNHQLIQKLFLADCDLFLVDGIDFDLHDMMFSLYVKYSEELFMRDKIKFRDELIENLRLEFVEKPKTQFEFNQLAWKFFSKFTNEDKQIFIEKDSALFKRHLNVASSYTFCAFLLGYYEPAFLSNLFTMTLKNLMALGDTIHVMSLKEKIEYLRMQDSFNTEDFKDSIDLGSDDQISKTMICERYDGSGIKHINSREMSDLEIVLVALNRSYGFDETEHTNILNEIVSGEIKCVDRILKMLQRVLIKRTEVSVASV